MMLIGKTANCLLGAYAHSAVLKAVDEFARMRKIRRSVNFALKCRRVVNVLTSNSNFFMFAVLVV